jgi:MoaA/NifB/PqqE/SkfB family radical SAM enzyme
MNDVTNELNAKLIIDGTKIGWWRERVEAWSRGERVAPITMDIAWTRRCNAACDFCAAKTQASASPSLDIPRDVAMQFLEDAAEIGVKGISLISDGESTLVDYYAESIEYAAKLGIKIGLGTNGIAFDREILERILPHVSYLRFNFSAGERKRYSEIMGVKEPIYDKVVENIRLALDVVRSGRATTNINMNLVSDPKDADQLMPFAQLAKDLGVHYAVIKHCFVDDDGMLKVKTEDYPKTAEAMKACESLTAEDGSFRVVAKWNRIGEGSKRQYTKCHGPQFILQMSGNGLIAPCGPFFSEKYKAFHIGNILRTRFKDLFHSERYWEVMNYLGSEHFDPSKRCPPNCLQHLANDWLFKFKAGERTFPITPVPPHPEFV